MQSFEVFQLLENEPRGEMVSDFQWDSIGELAKLTFRELEVCKFLFAGYTRQEVADELNIKNRTARKFTEQLHEKLNVSNRAGLVLRVIQLRDMVAERRSPERGSVNICITCRKVIISNS